MSSRLDKLLEQVRQCDLCKDKLAHEPRPVLMAGTNSVITIIGQAPGTRVHKTKIPWNDPSGDLLRVWLGVSKEEFYDTGKFSIIPMGFCYPGKGKSGDLPPRPECAPTWHEKLMHEIPDTCLTVLVGQYAQKYYLHSKDNLTTNVKNYRQYLPRFFPLPHPSPRNRMWLKNNPWFVKKVIPEFRQTIQAIL